MTPLDTLREKREAILRIAAEHGARNVRVFGSVARGDTTTESDIDFLIHMEDGRSYFDLVNLEDDLEAILGCEVDVLTDGGISPYLEKKIMAEAIPL